MRLKQVAFIGSREGEEKMTWFSVWVTNIKKKWKRDSECKIKGSKNIGW